MKYWYLYLFFCFIPVFSLLFSERREKKAVKIIYKKRNGGNAQMKELLETMVGKKCKIATMSDHLLFDTYCIKQVAGNGILCEDTDGNDVIFNIDYVESVTEVREAEKKKR